MSHTVEPTHRLQPSPQTLCLSPTDDPLGIDSFALNQIMMVMPRRDAAHIGSEHKGRLVDRKDGNEDGRGRFWTAGGGTLGRGQVHSWDIGHLHDETYVTDHHPREEIQHHGKTGNAPGSPGKASMRPRTRHGEPLLTTAILDRPGFKPSLHLARTPHASGSASSAISNGPLIERTSHQRPLRQAHVGTTRSILEKPPRVHVYHPRPFFEKASDDRKALGKGFPSSNKNDLVRHDRRESGVEGGDMGGGVSSDGHKGRRGLKRKLTEFATRDDDEEDKTRHGLPSRTNHSAEGRSFPTGAKCGPTNWHHRKRQPLARHASSLGRAPSDLQSSSRVIRASREGTPTNGASLSSTEDRINRILTEAREERGLVGETSARTIYTAPSFRGLIPPSSTSRPARELRSKRRQVVHSNPKAPEDAESNDSRPTGLVGVGSDCKTRNQKQRGFRSLGRQANTRGFDEATQEYRELSKEIQKLLPRLIPCRKCLVEGESYDDDLQGDTRGADMGLGVGGGKATDPSSFRLMDVEAALILSNMDRDERLLGELRAGDHKAKLMFLTERVDHSQPMPKRVSTEKERVQAGGPALRGTQASADDPTGILGVASKRKSGIVRNLCKGVCGNCGIDESGAIMWRTDLMVKEQFGLRRKLCNRCGLYKQTNMADRPILRPPIAPNSSATDNKREPPENFLMLSPTPSGLEQESQAKKRTRKRAKVDKDVRVACPKVRIGSAALEPSSFDPKDTRKLPHPKRDPSSNNSDAERIGSQEDSHNGGRAVRQALVASAQPNARLTAVQTFMMSPMYAACQPGKVTRDATHVTGPGVPVAFQRMSPGSSKISGFYVPADADRDD